ncbi:MAG: tetratricopeptide repeat protein [Syntrophobacterales bacterium]
MACIFLVLATLAVYWGVKDHQFIHYDDDIYVINNPPVRAGLTFKGLTWAFTTLYPYWHPLTWLSHMLDCQVFGLHPGAHHLTSLFFHIANALLLFLWLQWVTGALGRSFLVAALFALHPLHVESVTWVAERKDVLSTFFWLLTMWAYAWYAASPGLKRYALVLICFCLGLMSKPMLVTLPLVLLVLDYWPLGRWSPEAATAAEEEGTSERRVSLPRLLYEKAPLLALAALASLITFYGQKAGGAVFSPEWLTLTRRLANALVAYVSYMVKMVWPSHLALLYPLSSAPLPLWQPLGAALLLIVLSFVVIRYAPRYPYLPVGWLWYLGTLVPVIGLVQVGSQAMADRFTYMPLIGLFIIVAWGMVDLTTRWRAARFLLPAGAGLILLLLALVSWGQVRLWRNSITLFEYTLKVTGDNQKIQNNLGLVLFKKGRLDEAAAHFKEALRLKPDYADANYNLGLILMSRGKRKQAIYYFEEALRLNPYFAPVYNDLGLALAQQGKVDQAIALYQKALRLDSHFAFAYNNLGNAFVVKGKIAAAIACYQKALHLDPNNALSHFNLGLALKSQGQVEPAILHFREAVRLNPNKPPFLNKLARIWATAGQPKFRNGPAAVQLAERANQITAYSQAEMLDTLAAAYAEAGRFPEAIQASRKGVDLALASGRKGLANRIESKMRLYQAGRPYHEGPGRQN